MKTTKTSIPRGSEVGHPKDTYWTPTPEEKKKCEAATKDMARIKKEFKYSTLGITPEMAEAVNAHVKEYGRGEIYNHFGDADGNDPKWWDRRNGRVYTLKLKTEWVPVR
jgi:hypothetical protein